MSKDKPVPIPYDPVDATPVKSFFVSMLTRDIRLEDAILDLLDNCVDGILRSRNAESGARPYAGFWAKIEFDKKTFTISDNCGGIPWSLHGYAFRMGRDIDRPNDVPGVVGVYGIGMKRAIFKLGEQCLISTQNANDRYEVDISSDWVHDQSDWRLPVKKGRSKMNADGTELVIGNLHSGVSTMFSEDAHGFSAKLADLIKTHYAFILNKGFCVTVNGTEIAGQPTKLVFMEQGKNVLRPFIYQTEQDGVKVFLAVGFTRPLPSQNEVEDEQSQPRYSSLDAGWTIVCNDRAVVYCDRTELTGWGEAGVPNYHTQFIAISGIVEFVATDASKLPTTTTKRGVDASSRLYLQVKNKMREGMRLFTDYTNKWKSRAKESQAHFDGAQSLSLPEIKAKAVKIGMHRIGSSSAGGSQYKPQLPMPRVISMQDCRVSYTKKRRDVESVAEYLFRDAKIAPSAVGERCFDLALREAQK